MKLGTLILQAQSERLILRKKDTPRLFVVVIGNDQGGRIFGGYQPVAGKGLYGCFPYILQFCLPGLDYFQLLHTDGWFLVEDSKKEYEFFRALTAENKWDVSAGIDHITKNLSGVAVVTYQRE